MSVDLFIELAAAEWFAMAQGGGWKAMPPCAVLDILNGMDAYKEDKDPRGPGEWAGWLVAHMLEEGSEP